MRHCFNFYLTPTQNHMMFAFGIGLVADVKEDAHSVLCPSLATQDLSFFHLSVISASNSLRSAKDTTVIYETNADF